MTNLSFKMDPVYPVHQIVKFVHFQRRNCSSAINAMISTFNTMKTASSVILSYQIVPHVILEDLTLLIKKFGV